MPHNRYYINTPFHDNQSLILSDGEFHHLARVSRVGKGSLVELVNGRGQLAQAEVIKLSKHDAELRILNLIEKKTQNPTLILAPALTRLNLLEWTIEKGTELGVTAFWLFPGMLSEKDHLSETQSTRLQNLTISAMKQCGRLDLPKIELKPPLLNWENIQGGSLFFGNSTESAPAPYLDDLSLPKPLSAPVVFFIGPESGFDPRESSFLQDHLQAKGVRLHQNTLRAETASIVALSLIHKYL